MRRGTTPTITITCIGETFDDSDLFVTLEQGCLQITKSGEDVIKTVLQGGEDCTVAIYLTQEETLMLTKGSAQIQIRWINNNGLANASPIKSIKVDPILLEGVIEYGA